MMPRLPADAFDSIVSDPPYGLSFMGKQWDHGVPGVPFWTAAKRVLKPGGYMLVMGGTRTYHRLACAVEDAGFEIRDCLMWIYGSGFPKAKSCLKPAYEPILLCRKPGKGMRELGVDDCRIPANGEKLSGGAVSTRTEGWDRPWKHDEAAIAACRERSAASVATAEALGRWPANVLHDGSDEVMEAFAVFGEKTSGSGKRRPKATKNTNTFLAGWPANEYEREGDTGSVARFFYCAKAARSERGEGNTHPTVKPLALMEWLVKLVTPKGGKVLDPFAGSGTTGLAAKNTGRDCVMIEREAAYCEIIRKRCSNKK